MEIKEYDYVKPKKIKGKIILSCFPGRGGEKISFREDIFLKDLKNFCNHNCSILVTLVEDDEIEKLCNKNFFVQQVYNNGLKWIHMPIKDLKTPNHDFINKWKTAKVLLKNDLIEGKNIVIHCMGGKGRSGTVASILLIEFSENNKNAIEIVRRKRKGAIETKKQEDFILSYKKL